jgi:hypothetical protein
VTTHRPIRPWISAVLALAALPVVEPIERVLIAGPDAVHVPAHGYGHHSSGRYTKPTIDRRAERRRRRNKIAKISRRRNRRK